MCWVHFIMFSAYSGRACYKSDMLFANLFRSISCISAGERAAKLSPDNLRSCWLHFRHTQGLFFRVFLSWIIRTLEMDSPSHILGWILLLVPVVAQLVMWVVQRDNLSPLLGWQKWHSSSQAVQHLTSSKCVCNITLCHIPRNSLTHMIMFASSWLWNDNV
jgi:hypothetical protein